MADVEPPDGGFGWFVALGTFIVFFVVPGQAYSFGVLYVEFLDAFGASKASTAWIGTLYFSTGIVGIPLSMALINKYSHRKVMMIGGITSSIGIFASSFVSSLGQMYIIYGVMTSFCHWLLSVPALAIVRRYFRKRLSIAMGIGVSGTGAGQFALSFLTQIFIDNYGWRGTLLILSAINLNICVAGALFRPIEVYHFIKQRNCQNTIDATMCSISSTQPSLKTTETRPVTVSDVSLENNIYSDCKRHELEEADESESLVIQNDLSVHGEEMRDDVAASDHNIRRRIQSCATELRNFLKGGFDWSLFKNLAFVLIIVTAFGSQAASMAALTHGVKRGRDYDISSLLSSSLPAIMGMAQFLGRIFWGIVGGVSKKVKPIILYGGSMAVAGIASIISIHTTDYTGQLVYFIILGISMACITPTYPVVFTELLESDRVDHAIMFYILAQTVSTMLSVPFVGWMRDINGDYDIAYYIIGMLFIVAAICAFLAPVANKYVVKRNEEKRKGTTCFVPSRE